MSTIVDARHLKVNHMEYTKNIYRYEEVGTGHVTGDWMCARAGLSHLANKKISATPPPPPNAIRTLITKGMTNRQQRTQNG
jgi:hypothetical protein